MPDPAASPIVTGGGNPKRPGQTSVWAREGLERDGTQELGPPGTVPVAEVRLRVNGGVALIPPCEGGRGLGPMTPARSDRAAWVVGEGGTGPRGPLRCRAGAGVRPHSCDSSG